jgi:hypothetical protein
LKRRSICSPAPSSACAASATFLRRRAATGVRHALFSMFFRNSMRRYGTGVHHQVKTLIELMFMCCSSTAADITEKETFTHGYPRAPASCSLTRHHRKRFFRSSSTPPVGSPTSPRRPAKRSWSACRCVRGPLQFELNSSSIGVDWQPFHVCKWLCWLGSNV